MYITSTINSSTRSTENLPLLLLCHKDVRKLVLRPKRYSDLVDIAREKLALNLASVERVSFHTSTLDICKGQRVEIDESAYECVADVLDEILVEVGAAPLGEERVETPDRKEESSTRPIMPFLTPPNSTRQDSVDQKKQQQQQQQQPIKNRPTGAADKVHTPTSGTATRDSVKAKHERAHPPAERSVRAAAKKAAVPSPKAKKEEPKDDVFRLFDDEVQAGDARGDAGTLSRASSGRKSDETAVEESDAVRELPEAEVASPNNRVGSSSSYASEQRTPKARREAKLASSAVSNKVEKQKFTSVAATKTASPKKPIAATHSVAQSQSSDDDPRFNIMIAVSNTDQEAEFKTRGKHVVRKVLVGACKTFGVDCDQARLFLVRDDNEMFECPIESTVGACGIGPNARLFLHVEDSEVEGEGDSTVDDDDDDDDEVEIEETNTPW